MPSYSSSDQKSENSLPGLRSVLAGPRSLWKPPVLFGCGPFPCLQSYSVASSLLLLTLFSLFFLLLRVLGITLGQSRHLLWGQLSSNLIHRFLGSGCGSLWKDHDSAITPNSHFFIKGLDHVIRAFRAHFHFWFSKTKLIWDSKDNDGLKEFFLTKIFFLSSGMEWELCLF